MDEAHLDTVDGDENSSPIATYSESSDPLAPSTTISSQVDNHTQTDDEDEDEDELGEGEVAEDTITVFHNPKTFNVKHPLIHKWTLWYTKPSSGRPGESWADLLYEIQTFDSIEEFWGYICAPSNLPSKSDYHLFKHGIRPAWEDSANKSGGRFSFMPRERRHVDTQWLDTLLTVVGETLEPDGVREVQGVVVNVRKWPTRISCWTRTTGTGWGNMDGLMALGKQFKKVLKLKNGEKLEFVGHDESASSGSSRGKASISIRGGRGGVGGGCVVLSCRVTVSWDFVKLCLLTRALQLFYQLYRGKMFLSAYPVYHSLFVSFFFSFLTFSTIRTLS
ncbi:IF4E-domain-containing protein [Choiromyces venosus 120613-1]|uniref:IF4E-domain-containing protein n=1 Tax=Choiromyces venosus 120613-1 TaxID=1336337 RepID=A0A3N4JK86_9PEZI|nr:IF4E-domain-containing protein [Choiromyces venosus 120613-1]RPA98672.1 IF4E-domain-containing protein [Choiromyces venosus 120613-1]